MGKTFLPKVLILYDPYRGCLGFCKKRGGGLASFAFAGGAILLYAYSNFVLWFNIRIYNKKIYPLFVYAANKRG